MKSSDLYKTRPGLTRRNFIKSAVNSGMKCGAAGIALSSPVWLKQIVRQASAGTDRVEEIVRQAPAARYWISTNSPGVPCLSCHTEREVAGKERYDHGRTIIKCLLCAQACLIHEGERGLCGTRMNVRGTLKSLVYGRPISVHVDPIEKKPFYHFRPGSAALSLATAGCPLSCKFCQNWQISQAKPEDFNTQFIPPGMIVRATERHQAPVIAFTYNEPTVFTEYMVDIARLAREAGRFSVLISCGFMNEKPLDEMCDVLDAIKIDLKGFSRGFYQKVCHAELEPVLRSIKHVSKRGIHLEIVNLVVPTLNDSTEMLTELAKWVVNEVGPDVPVHFTRFHPDYQMLNLPPTPVATLEKAYDIARLAGIRYPFVGNVPGHKGNHTYCPECGKAVITRTGFFVSRLDLEDGRCGYCKEPIAGVF
jgi:pyruvate formate lyase activating enzyme